MTLRSTRQATSNATIASDLSTLQPIDCLLLAQAVWELGANSWASVAKILSKHPLLHHPKSFFTTQTCQAIYEYLMKDAGLEGPEEGLGVPHAPLHVQLAQKHYQARINELHSLILAEENKYKTIVAEIDAIRAGQWDDKLKAQLPGSGENAKEEPIASPDTKFEKPSSPTAAAEDQYAQPPTDSHPSPEAIADTKEPTFATDHDEDDQAVAQTLQASSPTEDEIADIQTATVQTPEPVRSPMTPASPEPEPSYEKEPSAEAEVEEHVLAEPDESHKLEALERPVTQSPPPEPAVEEEGPNADDVQAAESPVPAQLAPDANDANLGEDATMDGEITQLEAIPDEPVPPPEASVEVIEPAEEIIVKEEPAEPPRRTSRRRQSSVPFPTSTRSTKATALVESLPMEVDNAEPVSETESHLQHFDHEQSGSPMPQDETFIQRREGKRKASVIESPAEYLRDRKRLRDESEPLDEEEQGTFSAGPGRRRTGRQTEEQLANKRFQNVIGLLHSQISQHRNGTIFHNPIKNSEAPDYREIVKRPMDLKTIKGRIKDGVISNSLEFQRDIYLMFANAMMYNRPGSDIHVMADDMMLDSEENIHSFRQTEGFVRGTHGHRI